jgi:lambda family phage portal protein
MDLIGKLFPVFALRRDMARHQRAMLKRAYEGGRVNNLHRSVIGAGQSANENMDQAGEALRNKARYLDENHDLVIGIFDSLVNAIVGNSNPIRPLVRNIDGTLNARVNELLLQHWQEWSVRPDITGTFSMLQLLKLACRAWLRDGEFLTRFARGTEVKHHTPYPLSLELIEADFLPYEETGRRAENVIIQGVEFNKMGVPEYYHLLKNHPTDSLALINRETRAVVADDIVFLKFTRRPHQVRGVTLLHGVLNRLDDLKDYEESERIAARVAAAMTAFIQKPGETLVSSADDGSRQLEMSPGMIFDQLLPGETVGTIASNRPNPELINFRSSMLKAIAAGTGTNYSTISRSYDGTFSAQRQEMLEAKPNYDNYRQLFVDGYLRQIWAEFIKILQTQGKIPGNVMPGTLNNIEVRAVDIGWIDPQKQANAAATALENRISSRGQIIRDQGGDPAAVFAEIEEEEKRFGPPEPTTPAAPETENSDDDDEENSEQD